MSTLKNQQLVKAISLLCTGVCLYSTPSIATDIIDTIENRTTSSLVINKEIKEYRLVGVSLFAGKDFESKVISAATSGSISHVGLILSEIDNPDNDPKKWYSFESTGSVDKFLKSDLNRNNYLDKWKSHLHVQINPWEQAANGYQGDVSYRLFDFDDLITEEDKTVLSKGITNAVSWYKDTSYTNDPTVLIKALWGTNERRYNIDTDTFFCSELVAQVLMDLDIVAAGKPGNFLPKHFLSNRPPEEKLDVGFILRMGITLSDEQKWVPPSDEQEIKR